MEVGIDFAKVFHWRHALEKRGFRDKISEFILWPLSDTNFVHEESTGRSTLDLGSGTSQARCAIDSNIQIEKKWFISRP